MPFQQKKSRLALFSIEIVIKTPILLPFYSFTSLMQKALYIYLIEHRFLRNSPVMR